MRKPNLKSIALATVLVAGLSFASCKKETQTETETTVETTEVDADTTSMEGLDEEGARDTIVETIDTVRVTKP